MQTLHQALLLKKLYLLQSFGFDYCNPQFLVPAQKRFQSQNQGDLRQLIESCKLCAQKTSLPSAGLCHQNSKLIFLTLMPLLDSQSRFASKSAQMLKNIIERVFDLSLREVSILSLLKCEIPQNSQQICIESCMGYFLKQIEFAQSPILVLLGAEAYFYLTQDGSDYGNVQGKLLKWNHLKLFPTFSLSQLLRQPELKINAHKEFLHLKELLKEEKQCN
ncbi:MAG: uracil-DNA glycosylase [Helicobacter sp.]|uniref:uracil-DNA glycosylase family protein n=1 Tax=Helicobacter sp. TaxID=218 RepID=UPI0023D2B519|nr:uracil-DNA glycosylase family protein [Helicobacter sp.]MDE5925647.1 uracil-DNA glycosylase [Helicobacter sp.]MDE7176154.1 uracil-DNA glycosylase [Helicobacter sp.]